MLSDKLEDHIDEPIKKVVVGLNLLGLKTTMSCCGFTYKNEKVPKKHLQKSYVYIDLTETTPEDRDIIFKLATLARWTIGPLNPKTIDLYGPRWDNGHPWNDPNCPHYYEVFLLGIRELETTIDSMSHNFKKEVTTIQDGNSLYKNDYGIKHWQYELTKPWVVTKKLYETL